MEQRLLTLPQERALTSSLKIFEAALRKTNRLLDDGDEKGVFVTRSSSINAQQRRKIQEMISKTLQDLEKFATELDLQSTEENVEGMIMAEMSICWESLEESRLERLKGYGEINPQAIKMIDDAITNFAQVALKISQLVASAQDRYDNQMILE